MIPRAKSKPAKKTPGKPASAKVPPTVEPEDFTIPGLRTPGDRAGSFDLRSPNSPWEKRRDIGKALRDRTPRESHADTKPGANRPDPLDLLAASNGGRLATGLVSE